MFLSSLETFNYWTLWISSEVPSVLTLSSKLTRPNRQRVSFPTNGLIVQRYWTAKSYLPMTHSLAFCAIANPLKKITFNSGLTTEQAVAKLRMDRIPPTGAEKYSYLQSAWENINMQCFSDFFKCYNNKDVVPTLEAMQKMIEFYHNKGVDMLKLGCTLANLANIRSHKSTDSKCYPFTESDKDLVEKIREDMVGGPSVVFTRKAVVDETFIRKSSNLCKSIVGIDASQLNVSTNAYWIVHAMGMRFWNQEIHNSPKQISLLWEYGSVVISTKSTRLQNWE